MSDANDPWAQYLREATKRPGWSVARLARESGVHRASIFRWLGGHGGTTVDSVRAIAQALGDDPAVVLRTVSGGLAVDEARTTDMTAEDVAEKIRYLMDLPDWVMSMSEKIRRAGEIAAAYTARHAEEESGQGDESGRRSA